MLPEKDRNRLAIISNESQADYIVTNYFGNNKDYESRDDGIKKVKVFRIKNEQYLEIYQRSNR
jgi:hypothetical protein